MKRNMEDLRKGSHNHSGDSSGDSVGSYSDLDAIEGRSRGERCIRIDRELSFRVNLRICREIEVSLAAHDDAGAAVDVRLGFQVCIDADGSLEVGAEVGGATDVGVSLAVDDGVAAEAEAVVRGAVCGELDVRGKIEASLGVEGSADVRIAGAVEGRVCLPLERQAKVQSSIEAAVGCDDAVSPAGLRGAWDTAESLGDEAGAGTA